MAATFHDLEKAFPPLFNDLSDRLYAPSWKKSAVRLQRRAEAFVAQWDAFHQLGGKLQAPAALMLKRFPSRPAEEAFFHFLATLFRLDAAVVRLQERNPRKAAERCSALARSAVVDLCGAVDRQDLVDALEEGDRPRDEVFEDLRKTLLAKGAGRPSMTLNLCKQPMLLAEWWDHRAPPPVPTLTAKLCILSAARVLPLYVEVLSDLKIRRPGYAAVPRLALALVRDV